MLDEYAKTANVSGTYVTKDEFETYVMSGGQSDAVNLSVYAKNDTLAYYAKKEELNALNIPSVEGLASETYVDEKVAAIQIPSTEGFATKEDLNALNIPSVEGLASETYVNEKVAAIQIPSTEGFATKEDLNALNIPSVEGLASESYVNEKVAAIEIPSVPTKLGDLENDVNYITLSDIPTTDLTGYATTAKMQDTLKAYPTTEKMNDTLKAYVLKSEIGSTNLEGYYSKAEVDALLAEMNERFAALSDWVEASKNPKLSKPTLYKEEATDITVYAKITSAGFGDIIERGFVCSRTPNPTVAENEKKYVASGTTVDENYYGGFSYLASGYTYYIRAYATSSTGTGYGEALTLTTTLMAPVINSGSYSDVTAESVTMHSSVKFEAQITQWGFCYSSTTETPTISNDKVTVDVAGTDFEATISGLRPGKKYYVRPFAENSKGTIYGSTYYVTTLAVPPTVEGLSTTEVAGKSFKVTAEIADFGGADLTAKGFCYSTSENPTIEDSKVSGEWDEGDNFIATVTGLSPVTTYYVRAYATNSAGTSYSEQITVTTTAVLATVATVTSSDITGTSFKISSEVTDNGGAEVTQKGFCYATTENPTVEDSKKVAEGDEFETTIDELSPVTTYYVRAYAVNSAGTAYSEQTSITTLAVVATIADITSSEVTGVSFKVSSEITTNGGAEVTEKGFCYATTENPTVEDTKKAVDGDDFETTIDELANGTIYYVRAYAVNSVGTAYSEQISVLTLAPATVADVTSSDITGVSFKVSSEITANGGAEVTEKGFCYATTENPTVEDSKKIVDGDDFEITIDELSPVTTYYVRAYAVNSVGTTYSEQISVTTLAVLATLGETTSSDLTGVSFKVSSEITDNGGAEVTEKGFCYATTENPTVENSKKAVEAADFETTISELANGTAYYVRAYAVNSAGTAYSEQISVLTLAPATVASVTSSDITGTSFKVSSEINANGGAEVTEKGFCYATTENPTVEDSKKAAEGDDFETIIEGLFGGTTYFVRAYATNSVGTAYSEQLSVKTLATSAIVSAITTSNITGTAFNVASVIIFNGGEDVSEKGFCYSTTENPTVEDSKKIVDGDDFETTIEELAPGTTYFVRAYAVNSIGIGYSEQKLVATPPIGGVNGAFSVSPTKQVFFSQGNLQYNAMQETHDCADGTTKKGTWRFAENQWDWVGSYDSGTVYENGTMCNNQAIANNYNGWIDLFGWATSGYENSPWMSSSTNYYTSYYVGGSNNSLVGEYANNDWGVYNAISNGGNQAGLWRTLTNDEWTYLINTRTDASSKSGIATVNDVTGFVLLPDNWTLPAGLEFTSGVNGDFAQNNYSAADWTKMEENGAVFLPAAGYRGESTGKKMMQAGLKGYYHSTTAVPAGSYILEFSAYDLYVNNQYENRYHGSGLSVRLVQDIE